MTRLLMVATIPITLNRFLGPFANHFRVKGWTVDGMASEISSDSTSKSIFNRVWDVEWSRNPLDPRNFLKAPQTIQSIVNQERYDLIHVHTPVAGLITRFSLRKPKNKERLKIVYTAHGFHFHPEGKPLKNVIFTSLEKVAGHWTDYLVVINRDDFESAKQHKLLPPERICYMPGIGVDLEYYNPDRISRTEIESFRREIGLPPNSSLFLCIAEFISRKRHEDLIHAFSQLPNPNVYLALVGVGPLMEDMKSLARSLGVDSRVYFLGYREDIPILVRASIATILVSQQEGLPRSIMESLSLEIPVIGTNIRGIQDLLHDDCGMLVEVGDINALAKSMSWMLKNPEAARNMGKQGRIKMVHHDLNHVIDLHENLYAKAINQ